MPTKPTTKKLAMGGLTFFVTIIIPITAWLSGILPSFATDEDLKALNVEQLQLRQEFTNDKILLMRREQRELQQKQYELRQSNQEVPGFYDDQYESNARELDKLERSSSMTQQRIESLRSDLE